jgi:hypothetical protein
LFSPTWVRKVHKAYKARKVHRDCRAPLVLQARKGCKEPRVIRARLARWALLVLPAPPAHKGCKDPKVIQARLARWVPPELPAPPARRGRKVPLVLQARKGCKEPKVIQARLARWVLLDLSAPLVLREPKELRGPLARQVRKERVVHKGLKGTPGHLAPWVRRDLLVLRDRWVHKVLLDRQPWAPSRSLPGAAL